MRFAFLDESGFSKNWTADIDSQPFYVLAAFLIDSEKYFHGCDLLRNNIKNKPSLNGKFPLGHGFEIKASDISQGRGKLRNLIADRNYFRDQMLTFPNTNAGKVFLVVVDKRKHLNRYLYPELPHEQAFKYILERLQKYLKSENDTAVCVYDQTKFLDDKMHSNSTELIRQGSEYTYLSDYYGRVKGNLKIDSVKEFYLGKSDNSIGIQIADFYATYTYQYFKKKCPEDCGWWQTITENLHNNNGVINGYGLKMAPDRD